MSLLGFAILFASLGQPGASQRPVPFMHYSGECFADSHSSLDGAFIPLKLEEWDGEKLRSFVEMETETARVLLASKTIGFQMLADQKTATILYAEMVFSEKTSKKTTAKYTAKKGALIQDNRRLDFHRDLQCSSNIGSDSQIVTIRIHSQGSPSLALKGQFAVNKPPSTILWLRQASDQGVSGFASPLGWRDPEQYSERFSKAQLLAHMWGFSIHGDRYIYSLLILAAVVWLGGIFALTSGTFTDGVYANGITLAIGTVCLFASTGLVYLTISPPFQGPDEADHFLTYTRLNNLPALADNALAIANGGHFERIKFKTDEKFSAADVNAPMVESWARHIDPNNPNRSPLAKWVWVRTTKLVDPIHAGTALLCLRVLNILFVSACIGFSIAVAAWCLKGNGQPIFMIAPILLTPSICYFSTVFSNYPFLIGGYIFQAVALGLIWQSDGRERYETRFRLSSGFLAGSGVMIAVISSDNGIFSIAFWGILIPLIFLISPCRADVAAQRDNTGLLAFHAAFAAPLVFAFAVSIFQGPDHLILPDILVWSFDNKLPLFFRGSLSLQTWVFVVFPVVCFAFSMLLHRVGLSIRNTPLIRYAKAAAAGILIFGCLMILLRSVIPIGENAEPYITNSLSGAVFAFLRNFLEGFGPGPTNELVVNSFWGSLGWLDTPLPAFLVETLRFFTATGVYGLVTMTVLKKCPQRLGLLTSVFFGLLLYAVFLSAGYWTFDFAPNSRYLIGLYLLTMVVAYEGIRLLVLSLIQRQYLNVTLNSALCVVCMITQCAAWLSVVNRYL
jgi:hypothetical protein